MASYIWSRTNGSNGPSLSVIFDDGETKNLGSSDINFGVLTKRLAEEAPADEIRSLFQPVKSIATRLQRLSDRVTTDGNNLYFDGDALHDALADYILGLVRLENEDADAPSWKPFVNFLEKLAQNPNEESRKSLYTFIQKHGLTIRPDGDFIAYKGIQNNLNSVRSGPGIVDNKPMNGHLPNKPGSILEMARSSVNSSTGVHCGVGLHVGTYEYAKGWGPTVTANAINPRDVVAVPDDGAFHKIRVARYEVLLVVKKEEEVVATVGKKSAPVYTPPTTVKPAPVPAEPKLNEEFVQKLKKAIKKERKLKVTYVSGSGVEKTYVIKPTAVEGKLVRLELPDEGNGHRSFRIDRIKSVKKLG